MAYPLAMRPECCTNDPTDPTLRVTEDGSDRVTEDGDQRITEES